ncbi:putative membrane protein [Arcobacter venerupis]|uniref:Membrane protein n=1 Tax=Arcobacter venerupis TaxID=1054033 RepID=A0AAE7E2J6_9BACT|nr:hypothetical protein [Arcobacter venerupis]QKF66188.1 putative membrane protein [Arcobacter venerupis]RWS51026.1 hypothetical protein CKA56_01480 [Arcobacter venerupis]
MKKIIYIFLLISSYIYAHEIMMNVVDNKDNTVTVIGGETIPGALIKFESLKTGEVLFKQRLPQESELTISIPNEPYQIVLDAGPGEKVVKDGILLSGDNFDKSTIKAHVIEKLTKPEHEEEEFDSLTLSLFIIGFILLLLTIYFSAKNSNKILIQLKDSHQHT